MQKLAVFILIFLLVGLTVPGVASAKKKLPSGRNPANSSTTVGAKTSTKGVTVHVRLRPDRQGIIATFSNLEIASSVSYSLTYTSRGIQEGAGGSITDLSGTQTRELIFGTCSAGVCRYHPNPKNVRFTVTTKLNSGKKVSKVFRIKV